MSSWCRAIWLMTGVAATYTPRRLGAARSTSAAINRALRAFRLPLLIRVDDPDQDAEPMGKVRAALLIAFYGFVYGPGWIVIFAAGRAGHRN